MGRYFGTDGIRDRADGAKLAPQFVRRVGSALGRYLAERGERRIPVVALGRDPRPSGARILQDLHAGLSRHTEAVYDLGMVPTPAVSRAVLRLEANLGIVITASHNPASDNGIKLFGADGAKLSEAEEAEIEAHIESEPELPADAVPAAPLHTFNALGHYVGWASALLHQGSFAGMRAVIDTANGGMREAAPRILQHLGLEFTQIGDACDGAQINSGVGSEHPESLVEAMRRTGTPLGLAFDGDGDRLVVVGSDGQPVAGEALLALLAVDRAAHDRLPGQQMVTTIHSNLGLDHFLKQHGITTHRSAVGDRAVAALMRETGASFGGESSGHLVIADRAPTGDGLLSAIEVLHFLQRAGRPIEELAAQVGLFPQATENIPAPVKPPLEDLPQLAQVQQKWETQLGDQGRLLLRYSGTEPRLRLLVEAPDLPTAQTCCQELAAAATADLEAAQ